MKKHIQMLWFWLFRKSLRHLAYVQMGACANRYTKQFNVNNLEYTVVCRVTNEPDGYSREELYRMLQTIRKHEAIQKWKVPEPDAI